MQEFTGGCKDLLNTVQLHVREHNSSYSSSFSVVKRKYLYSGSLKQKPPR